MTDVFWFVIALLGITLLLAYLKRISKDKCLKGFSKSPVTIITSQGKEYKGILSVENTGLEIHYLNTQGKTGSSYIFYKQEYSFIPLILRYKEDLTKDALQRREKIIQQIYNPSLYYKIKQSIINIVKAARDGFVEILSLFLGMAKSSTPFGKAISAQKHKAKQIGEEVINFIGTAYEPLLEKHIGDEVIIAQNTADNQVNLYKGFLLEYTSEFITILNVSVQLEGDERPRIADIIINREHGQVRHKA